MGALKAQIDRKVVRAPFAGKLGIRSVNLGQYLNPGTPITMLESLESVFVDFTIPQQELARVPVGLAGAHRAARHAARRGPWTGKIAAVDPSVDPATRAVKLRASVKDDKDELRPGMFVNVSVLLPERANVVSVPATAIVHAPYGDSVFVIETRKDDKGRPVNGPDGKPAKIARQQFVRARAGARRLRRHRRRGQGRPGGGHAGRVQAAQRRPGHGQQPGQADALADPAAREPLT